MDRPKQTIFGTIFERMPGRAESVRLQFRGWKLFGKWFLVDGRSLRYLFTYADGADTFQTITSPQEES